MLLGPTFEIVGIKGARLLFGFTDESTCWEEIESLIDSLVIRNNAGTCYR
jgi:hypothetical protein